MTHFSTMQSQWKSHLSSQSQSRQKSFPTKFTSTKCKNRQQTCSTSQNPSGDGTPLHKQFSTTSSFKMTLYFISYAQTSEDKCSKPVITTCKVLMLLSPRRCLSDACKICVAEEHSKHSNNHNVHTIDQQQGPLTNQCQQSHILLAAYQMPDAPTMWNIISKEQDYKIAYPHNSIGLILKNAVCFEHLKLFCEPYLIAVDCTQRPQYSLFQWLPLWSPADQC